jgi:hypothetical protein
MEIWGPKTQIFDIKSFFLTSSVFIKYPGNGFAYLSLSTKLKDQNIIHRRSKLIDSYPDELLRKPLKSVDKGKKRIKFDYSIFSDLLINRRYISLNSVI